MPTNNSINSGIPIEITKGGTLKSSFVSNATIAAGTTGTGALQDTGPSNAAEVLTSQGAGSKALFTLLPTLFNVVASDPVSPSPGDTWYNSTTHLFKGAVAGGGGNTWVVKTGMNIARVRLAAGGDSNDTLAMGGNVNGTMATTNTCERYSGIADTWTNRANMPQNRSFQPGAAGTSGGDTLIFGGTGAGNLVTNITRLYNGVSNTWSNRANMGLSREFLGGCGTSTDALAFGGTSNPGSDWYSTTERFDGIGNVWGVVSSLNTGRQALAGSGVANGAMAMGGNISPSNLRTATTEYYDGSVWTNKAALPASRGNTPAAGGVSTGALFYGGLSTTYVATTYSYDLVGNAWSTVSSMNFARNQLAGTGTNLDALAMGGGQGFSPFAYNINERYTSTSPATIVTFTVT